MKIGYARVSTKKQDNTAQIEALKKAGCTVIYQEKISGGRWDRPELHNLLNNIDKGDIVVVWKLDRFSRSLKDLLHLLEKLDHKQVGFVSLTESIDTTTAAGKMMMHIIGAFAEFERNIISERTLAGLAQTKKKSGRRFKLNTFQREQALSMIKDTDKTAADIARLFRVHPATICRLIANQG